MPISILSRKEKGRNALPFTKDRFISRLFPFLNVHFMNFSLAIGNVFFPFSNSCLF